MSGLRGEIHQGTPQKQTAIWVAMVTIYIVWGSTYFAIRIADKTIPPLYMASVRFLIAGTILFIYRLLSGDPFPTKLEWRSARTIGLFLLLGGNGGVVWAEQRVPSSLAALIVGAVPIWMVLMDIIKHRGRKPNGRVLGGIILGFSGIMLLFWPGGSNEANRIDPTASLVLIGSSISWAFGSLYSRNAKLPISPLMGTSMEMLAGGFGLLLFGTILGETRQLNFHTISTSSLAGLIYLIIFGSLVGFVAYTWLLRVAPISLVSTYAYVNPLVAIIIGYIFGNETFTSRTLIAAGIILGSVVMMTTFKPPVEIAIQESSAIIGSEELLYEPKELPE